MAIKIHNMYTLTCIKVSCALLMLPVTELSLCTQSNSNKVEISLSDVTEIQALTVSHHKVHSSQKVYQVKMMKSSQVLYYCAKWKLVKAHSAKSGNYQDSLLKHFIWLTQFEYFHCCCHFGKSFDFKLKSLRIFP